MLIGVDYHPSFQTIAVLLKETGEYGEQELNHSDGQAEKFYRDLKQRGIFVRVGWRLPDIHAGSSGYWLNYLSAILRRRRGPTVTEALRKPDRPICTNRQLSQQTPVESGDSSVEICAALKLFKNPISLHYWDLLRARSSVPEIVRNFRKWEQRKDLLERGLVLAKHVLSQLSYTPIVSAM